MRIAVILVLFCAVPASAQERRISMVDNSGVISIKEVVRTAIKAFDSEDLDAYESCFKSSRRKQVRRTTAHLFAAEECFMNLVDMHIIEDLGDSASVAVKYKFGGSNSSSVVLSEVRLAKEDGMWLIERELVRSKETADTPQSPSYVAAENPAAWNPMKPDPNKIPSEIHHLIGDVGIRDGFGCVGGRCANGRCAKSITHPLKGVGL